jgi:hypothetical protein
MGGVSRRGTPLARAAPHVIESRVRAGGLEADSEACPKKHLNELEIATMANSLLPPEERNLTPDQVEALDKRRDLGHTFLVIAGQFTVIAMVLLLWVGQDLTYSPGWAHPMAYYFFLAIAFILIFGITGLVLRRGTPRID